MSTALKHILRISGTEAALSAGATKLKNGQCGITTDTKKFVYMDLSGVFHVICNADDITQAGISVQASPPAAVAGKCLPWILIGDYDTIQLVYPDNSNHNKQIVLGDITFIP
jgi:hypothetical protein